MDILQIVFVVIAALVGLIMLIMAFRTKKPLSALLSTAGWGCGSLLAVVLLGRFVGLHVSLNWFTLGTSGILGLPGTIALVLAQSIW